MTGRPGSVRIEAMRLGTAHLPRNPTVFAMLARMGLVTDIGRGVLRMVKLVRDQTGRDVGIAEEAEELVVRIPRPAR